MINGNLLRDAIISAANNIANQKKQVDDLNVFPVPDGDTGTNMSMSIGNAARELERLDGENVSRVAATAASALLRGARGNSGVITSLLFYSENLESVSGASAYDIFLSLNNQGGL